MPRSVPRPFFALAPLPPTLVRALGLLGALALFLIAAPTAPAAGAADYPPENAETKALMKRVAEAVALVEAEGVDGACQEFRKPDSPWFQGETYVFVNDVEGGSLCHPAKPSLEGRSVLDLRDPHGKTIVRSFQRETEDDGEGWVHYLWPRPGSGTNFTWKTTYVRRAQEPSGRAVIVGSGQYQMPMERLFVVEQVEDAAALLAKHGDGAFEELRDKASGFRFYDSYLFVMDTAGVQLVNAAFPENEGRNLLDLADENGKVIGREILASLAEEEAAWVDYAWPRPGDEPTSRKSTYVRKVALPDGREVVVGAGIYLD